MQINVAKFNQLDNGYQWLIFHQMKKLLSRLVSQGGNDDSISAEVHHMNFTLLLILSLK